VVADEQLRDVLEFALDVVRAVKRREPGFVVPGPLKPVMRFTRLNAAGLATVRRVLEENPELRNAVGEAHRMQALEDGPRPEDALLEPWLRRPEGWEDAVAAYLAEVAGKRELQRQEQEERSTAKRLAAAERHLERARAELAERERTLSEERSKRLQAERRVQELTGASAALERQLEEARNETRRAKRSAESAGAASSDQRLVVEAETARRRELEIENERLASLLDDAIRARVEAESAQIVVAAPAEDTAVVSATETLREAARVLADATDSLSRVIVSGGEGKSQRTRAPKRTSRQPVPIPGGRAGDDIEVARFLVSVPNILVVVDGYNVAKTAWPDVALDAQRERLVVALENLVRRSGTRIRIVFDGADTVGWVNTRRLVLVQFSPPGMIADDVIREIVGALPDSQKLAVVTSDRELATSVRLLGANVVGSRQFLGSLR
jgi:hypothetical protein